MKKSISSIGLFLLLAVTACELLEPSGKSIQPLDSKIDFAVVESYPNYDKPSKPLIYLMMKTEKYYPCMNYYLVTDFQKRGNEITVDVLGIGLDNICLTAFGPAGASIELDNLKGAYKLSFVNRPNNFTDSYNLIINDSLIMVDGKESKNTKPLYNFYWRHPENSFAYICNMQTAEDSLLCERFIDTLKSVINLKEFTFPAIGVNPYIGFEPPYNPETGMRYFRYNTEGDFDKIETIMKSFKQNYFPGNEGINLTIINWLNKKIESRLL